VAQSRKREGCLILIADDADALVKHNVVQAHEINTCSDRIFAAFGPDPERPTIHMALPEISVKSLLLEQFRGRFVGDVLATVLSSLAKLDGALVVKKDGEILGFGIILRPPVMAGSNIDAGARSTAARAASIFGLTIKVSDNGPISGFKDGVQIA
jgi:hypothetical protein